ncbi:MAG: hypothetical protein OHK0046_32080 [Anaerolineae bacterium]
MSANNPNDPGHDINEDELREPSEFFESIGPEDETDEVIIDGLNDYGYDPLEEDFFEGVGNADQPETWMTEDDIERSPVSNNDNNDDPEDEYDEIAYGDE